MNQLQTRLHGFIRTLLHFIHV